MGDVYHTPVDTKVARDATVDIHNILNVLMGKPEWRQDKAAIRIEFLAIEALRKLKSAGLPMPEMEEPGEDPKARAKKIKRRP